MPDLIGNLPDSFNRYLEPFVGGGALFFNLHRENSYISDMNEELINLYEVVRDSVGDLIGDLGSHKLSKEYYLRIRNLDRSAEYSRLSRVQRASRFVYLNRTCFNGMYRVNSKGHFNVPYGRYKNPRILDEQNLINCSRLLQRTEIRCEDFRQVLYQARKGDFVYFDPPYVPLSATSSFTSYTSGGFDLEMQRRLSEVCDELDGMQVKFMLSNSDSEFVAKTYSKYRIQRVYACRAVNSNAAGRGKISEVLIRNY